MELKQIKELMTAMGRACIKRIVIKKEGFELQLEREDSRVCKINEPLIESPEVTSLQAEAANYRAKMALSRGAELPSVIPEIKKEDITATYVTSPMVGTFYSSPSPDEPSFVKVGDKIDKNQVVCIIEAMKVMNEVKAGVTGTIVEVLVENGHPVEFGTKLFRIS